MPTKPRLAFVTDSLPGLGGAEKVLFTALEAYPQADVFTLIYNRSAFSGSLLKGRQVRVSYLDKIPFAQRRHRWFLPLMPHAIEALRLRDYDAVIAFSYAVAHGVRPTTGTKLLSYTYTPMRYAWTDLNPNGARTRRNIMLRNFMQAFRRWDLGAAQRVDCFAAISQAIASRINGAYGRQAPVIHPPVEVQRFRPAGERQPYYITVSRLVAHKRLDLVIEAFSILGLPLLVIGEGPKRQELQTIAGPNIRFLGYVSDEKVAWLLSRARGFVCAAEEDFGIALVEAQAAGCPVIAYGQGGALETVIDGQTGLHFPEQSVDCIMEAVRLLEAHPNQFCTERLIQQSQKFAKPLFLQKFTDWVEAGISGV